MLQNEYLLAKFYADAAQNEPSKFGHLAVKSGKGTVLYLSTKLGVGWLSISPLSSSQKSVCCRTFPGLVLGGIKTPPDE